MMKIFNDMMNREVVIRFPPKRIVSLVPSQTELLFDLGLEEEVIGITKFCVHPESWFRTKTRVGGTKQLHLEKIKTLQPDLVIANKEENERDQIEELSGIFPVWISDIKTIDDALRMIREVGSLVNKEQNANAIISDISTLFTSLQRTTTPERVAYLIWYRPWMCAGGDTFISNMIETIGWTNVLKDHDRYPEITLKALAALQPELILLSSEPYPFKEQHAMEILEVLPHVDVKLVDGEMFSWYGSRMLKAIPYFSELLKAQ